MRQRVAQHQPALGIGVVDLDADAAARADHFAGTERVAGDRILDRRHQHGQTQRQSHRHHQLRQAQRMRSAAHVLLHVAHAVVGLDVQATGVEAHALADDNDMRMRRVAPTQFDQPRRAMRCAADCVDRRKIRRKQLVADLRLDFAAISLRQSQRDRFEFGRPHVLGRRVDQVAHQRAGLEQRERFRTGRSSVFQQQSRRRARGLAIALETVRSQSPAEHRIAQFDAQSFVVHAQLAQRIDARRQRKRTR